MPKPEAAPKQEILVEGSVLNVVFAQNEHGRSHARTYLYALSRADQRKFATLFDQAADGGRLTIPTKINDLGQHRVELHDRAKRLSVMDMVRIWEFKIDGHRMLAFRDRHDWVLTNGSPKVPKKSFQPVIQAAVNIASVYLNR